MKYAVALSLLVAGQAFATERIIYGDDNRVEPHQATKMQQRLAESTAGMLKSVKVVEMGKYAFLPPATIVKDMGLCKDERFAEQPSAVICSGFLVGPDLLVTAGHCISNQESCSEMSWVFDYKINKESGRANMMVPKSNVYKCSEVIDAKLSGDATNKRDYALVRLDRVVKGKKPLSFRTKGKVTKGDELFVIGHPSGLPTKVAGDAQVFSNNASGYFETNLDTFGGNSGSAVFNAKTGTVEGILVRGAKDYLGDGGCYRVNEVQQNIEGVAELGEAVSRITDIPALMARSKYLAAAKAGDLSALKAALAVLDDINMTDNEHNTALHIAVDARQKEIVNYLIGAGINIDHQNLRGETPLHRAAYMNNKYAISKLVVSGADLLVRDNYGVYASERTNYLAFGVRKMLRQAQNKEKRKRAKNL